MFCLPFNFWSTINSGYPCTQISIFAVKGAIWPSSLLSGSALYWSVRQAIRLMYIMGLIFTTFTCKVYILFAFSKSTPICTLWSLTPPVALEVCNLLYLLKYDIMCTLWSLTSFVPLGVGHHREFPTFRFQVDN